jgi:cytochrome b subunit of formate dehydrogenase
MMRVLLTLLLFLVSASYAQGADEKPVLEAQERLLPGEKRISKAEITDADCLDCHGKAGFSVPTGEQSGGASRRLDLNADALHQSVHGDYSCMDCHVDIEKLPHRKGDLDAVDCVSCHLQQGDGSSPSRRKWLSQDTINIVVQTKSYTHSIHARDSDKDNADCADCHTAHYVYPSNDTRSSAHKLNAPETCGQCHAEELEDYRHSIHGASLKTPWKGDSATCTDCHSAHQIDEKEGTKSHRVVTEQCESCHEREVNSYMATTHGQLAWLGNKEVARCQDCHQPHTTHAVDDPQSMIHKSNIQETCGECHEDAGESFTNFRAHSDISDYERNPELWWVSRIMVAIVILTLIFFYSHSMLWFWREIKSRPITWVKVDGRNYPVRAKRVKHNSGKHFQRFSWQWRVNHWALALSVMTLVFTGMAVMYPGTAWAMAAVKLVGGWQTFGYIHRTAAVIFLLAVFGHALVIIFRLVRKGGFQWFGPDSLLPRKKDWDDMKGQFRWFFGKGEQPRFDRWTYWEKFDYWAVYWGAFIIGMSGIILWFSPYFSRIFPGWVFNLATLAHGVEAFLAVMTLFVVHFFNNHFRPSKFPLDTVMFVGSWDLDEFKEERPEEYERLVARGELEKRLVAPPSKRANTVSHILGFTLLGIGLLLLVLVIIGFAQRGLV